MDMNTWNETGFDLNLTGMFLVGADRDHCFGFGTLGSSRLRLFPMTNCNDSPEVSSCARDNALRGSVPNRLSLGQIRAFVFVLVFVVAVLGSTRVLDLGRPNNSLTPETTGVVKQKQFLSEETELALNRSTSVPRVAWLMSFPNSGTSFTLVTVQRVSRATSASNYGKEAQNSTGHSIPVYGDPLKGPFWNDLDDMEPGYERPKSYVLTKTHCGGRCEKCGPSVYVETPTSFLKACLWGRRTYPNATGDVVLEEASYDASLVHKAVHLIRNPFDNVVSRFHLSQHRNSETDNFTATREGFRSFCKDLDDSFAQEEQESRLLDYPVVQMLKIVPCHADFIRYVQWHNLAFVTTHNLQIPTHILHYEDYGNKYEATVDKLLDFLELDKKGELMDFKKGKEYSEYFDNEEKEAVKHAMEKLASTETWEAIQRYFGQS